MWVLNIILQWIAVPNKFLLIAWKFTAVIEVSLYLSAISLFIAFLTKNKIPLKIKALFSSFIILVLLLTPSLVNIKSYDYDNCVGVIGSLWYVIYGFEIIVSIFVLIQGIIFANKKENYRRKREILIFSIALSVCLGLFTASNLSGEFLQTYSINLFGPIGLLVFIGLVTYLVIKYNSFHVKLISSQVLVWGLMFLIGSQFFFIKASMNFILNGVTFLGVIIFGRSLIKSIKVEIEQKEYLEQLSGMLKRSKKQVEETNDKLEKANEKLKGLDKLKTEFVSLASHQLRSPLTAIKGYASMLMEGDYGDISKEAKEAIDRMYESSKNLTIVVEDLLNVTKIESGGMKYEMVIFDLSQVAEDEAKDFTMAAEKKGLKLNFEKDESTYCTVNGDKEKIRQIIINFIDNSIKYTKEGEVNISVRNKGDKVLFCVKDTGVGMSEEIKESLFHKFARGDGSRMNTTGSGLGLYLAKQIVEAHHGRVWVESDGPGKGSAFYMELKAECCKAE